MAEPLSVCLHAMRQAGHIASARVLITGCGPIGALCILAARQAGAAEIVVSDLTDQALEFATRMGADQTLNVSLGPDVLVPFTADKGYFDICIEASGSAAALQSALTAVRPHGTIVQLGLGGDMSVPMNLLVAKEIQLVGSFPLPRGVFPGRQADQLADSRCKTADLGNTAACRCGGGLRTGQ